MKYKLATTLLVVLSVVGATVSAATTTTHPARAADNTFYVDKCPPGGTATVPPCDGDSVILRWDEELLSLIRAYPPQTGPTITARALGVFHTATYDAWAAYDPTAKVTRPDGPAQQQASLNTLTNKEVAISYAAYRVLIDLFPPGSFPPKGGYKAADVFLREVLNLPADAPIDDTLASPSATTATPAGVGNLAAKAVLDYRRGKLPRDPSALNPYGDGSNQVGDDPKGTLGVRYSDTTSPHYSWKNQWNDLPVPNKWKWQPLCVLTADGVTAWKADHSLPLLTPSTCPAPPAPMGSYYVQQRPLNPQWGNVITFSGLGPAQFKSMAPGPPKGPGGVGYSDADVATALADTDLSGADGDLKKAKAEYWADGPGSVFPPGHTAVFAQALSRKTFMNSTDSNAKLNYDTKLFLMVGNAEMDASIAAWWQKYQYDFWRPVTAIRYVYSGQQVKSWRGPGLGFQMVDGEEWMPYQALNVVTPNFPEYVSGHSTFTAAGASLLALFNGSDTFGASVKILQGSSAIEPGITPTVDVTLSWPTFSDASNEAGWSRRYGGIHFYSGDMHGRAIGRQVASYVYSKAQSYIKGSIGK